MSATQSQTAAPAAETAAPRTGGKPSRYTGKFIKVNTPDGRNPRRPNTHGGRAWAHYNPAAGGTTYEAWREAVDADPKIRGSLNHLTWDINHGYVEVLDEAPAQPEANAKPKARARRRKAQK